MNKAFRCALTIVLAVLIALACELMVFNLKAVASLGRVWTALPEPVCSGSLSEDKSETLVFSDINTEVRWCHFLIEVRDQECKPVATMMTIRISDDGSRSLYSAGEISYFPPYDKASYFRLNSYGKLHDLSVTIHANAQNCSYTLLAAEVNGSVPFRISIPRVVGLSFLALLFWMLRPGSLLYDNRFWNRHKSLKVIIIVLILLINLGVLFFFVTSNRPFTEIPDEPQWRHHHQYAKLARALTEGRTWIDTPEDSHTLELLSELDNPYDKSQRNEVFRQPDTVYLWDTAFFDGHLYVYFGIVPVLLTYLPYYLLTGSDMPTCYAAFLAFSLTLLAVFLFMRSLIRRYFPNAPFLAYLLLSVLLGNGSGLLCAVTLPSIYNVPIFFSQAFVFFALALWISAAERWIQTLHPGISPLEQDELCFSPLKRRGGDLAIGFSISFASFLAALVAGCRPQFLIYSALALPVFLPLIRQERNRAVTLRRLVFFILPYVAVAACLMYYNRIRFGSPFDFGANYNLTTNSMPDRGWRLGRLPDGLFSYLFCLPQIEMVFPYIRAVQTERIYMGRTIAENMYGGVLMVFPFLWSLLGLRSSRQLLKEKGLYLFSLLPLLLALIIIVADTEMAGILWRYTEDFLPLFYLSAALVYISLLGNAKPEAKRRWIVFLSVACFYTLLVCTLISFTDGALQTRTPEIYYRLRDFISWG